MARLEETSTWPLLPRGASGFVSSFGELAGGGAAAGRQAARTGALRAGADEDDAGAAGGTRCSDPDPGGTVGLDLKVRGHPALALTGTVNPDFGQVEADPAEVNLSAFETFFHERRPFFVEGSGAYQFDCDDCSNLYLRVASGARPVALEYRRRLRRDSCSPPSSAPAS